MIVINSEKRLFIEVAHKLIIDWFVIDHVDVTHTFEKPDIPSKCLPIPTNCHLILFFYINKKIPLYILGKAKYFMMLVSTEYIIFEKRRKMFLVIIQLLSLTSLGVVGQTNRLNACTYNVIIPQRNITEKCEELAQKEAEKLRKRLVSCLISLQWA